MLEMLVLHCHESSGTTMLILTEGLKNATSLIDLDAATWTRSSISNVEAHTILFTCPLKTNQGCSDLVNNLARIEAPALLSISQYRESQSNFWMRFWNGLRQHRACTSRFVEHSTGQYPLTLTVCVPKKVTEQRRWVCEAKHMDLWNNSPKIPVQKLTENCCWCLDWLFYVDLRRSKCACYGNLVCRSMSSLFRQWRIQGC
jgi:hypothetical protein